MFQLLLILSLLNFITSAPTLNSTNGDLTSCLKQFYQMAYDGELNCTSSLPLFSASPETQQKSFGTGKSCLLEFAKEECSRSQYALLSSNYTGFLETITTQPSEDDCSSTYFKYNKLKCGPMQNELQSKTVALQPIETKVNDSRLLELTDLCHRNVECMEPKCYYPEAIVKNFRDGCGQIQLKNSAFSNCLDRIQKQTPDLSEYSCQDGSDFNDESVKNSIEFLTLKKDCTKQIMEDFCGPKAVENFDADVVVALQMLKMTAKVVNVALNQ